MHSFQYGCFSEILINSETDSQEVTLVIMDSISESSSGYPEGASSNPARVNIFQLTLAV